MTNLRSTLENAISDLDTAIERECLEDVGIIIAYMREALAHPEPPADRKSALDEIVRISEEAGLYDDPPVKPLERGDTVTYTPRYGSLLPREGWTIDQPPPEATYIIKHSSGTQIAVSASEIARSAENRQPDPPCAHSDMERVDGHLCTSCGGYRSLDEPDAPLRHLNRGCSDGR